MYVLALLFWSILKPETVWMMLVHLTSPEGAQSAIAHGLADRDCGVVLSALYFRNAERRFVRCVPDSDNFLRFSELIYMVNEALVAVSVPLRDKQPAFRVRATGSPDET